MHRREFSLKRILIAALTLSCLFPLLLIGSISYKSIRKLQEKSVINSIRAVVRQNRFQVENMVSVLDSLTQLAVMEFISSGVIERYAVAKSYFDMYKVLEEIKDRLNMVNFANPDIGLILLYDGEDGTIIAQNTAASDDIDFGIIPQLFHSRTFTIFGPCPTLLNERSEIVISATRLIPNESRRRIYLYLEIGNRSLGEILGRRQYGIEATHFIVNMEETICYTDNAAEFPLRAAYAVPGNTYRFMDEQYVVFVERSNTGWQMMVAFNKKEFDAARMNWLGGFLLTSLLSVAVSLLIALFIWRILYVPFMRLRAELETVGSSRSLEATPPSSLRELNYLMDKVTEMRRRIATLIDELKANELKKRQLEVEKLLFQINPHFLYNTLNNVQWLARISGQHEITTLASALNKVLHYNLRKTGEMTTVRDEIEMLESYISIQKLRLDLLIELSLTIDQRAYDAVIPRFILQPLVENAILHSQRSKVTIEVGARWKEGGDIELEVRDNGVGMPEETLRTVLSRRWDAPVESKNGLGIRYVKSVIDMVYGDRGIFRIESPVNQGTLISISLPAGESE